MAVEMLRGPDHIAIRSGGIQLSPLAAAGASPSSLIRRTSAAAMFMVIGLTNAGAAATKQMFVEDASSWREVD